MRVFTVRPRAAWACFKLSPFEEISSYGCGMIFTFFKSWCFYIKVMNSRQGEREGGDWIRQRERNNREGTQGIGSEKLQAVNLWEDFTGTETKPKTLQSRFNASFATYSDPCTAPVRNAPEPSFKYSGSRLGGFLRRFFNAGPFLIKEENRGRRCNSEKKKLVEFVSAAKLLKEEQCYSRSWCSNFPSSVKHKRERWKDVHAALLNRIKTIYC